MAMCEIEIILYSGHAAVVFVILEFNVHSINKVLNLVTFNAIPFE